MLGKGTLMEQLNFELLVRYQREKMKKWKPRFQHLGLLSVSYVYREISVPGVVVLEDLTKS